MRYQPDYGKSWFWTASDLQKKTTVLVTSIRPLPGESAPLDSFEFKQQQHEAEMKSALGEGGKWYHECHFKLVISWSTSNLHVDSQNMYQIHMQKENASARRFKFQCFPHPGLSTGRRFAASSLGSRLQILMTNHFFSAIINSMKYLATV